MKPVNRYPFPLLIACCLLCAVLHVPKNAAAGAAVWSYHENNYEVHTPVISKDNMQLAFVRKLHVPDGHEAELFSDEELRKFMEPLETNPRFEDPEIMVMNLSDKNARFIDFGWEPSFSPDQTKLYYAHQKKPISGLRVLGTTLAGNDIRAYTLSGGESAVVAEPTGGYLSSPWPAADGRILYALSDAVNGAWGAAIGVGAFEPGTGEQGILYKPEQEHGLYHLVQTFEAWNGTCFVLRLRPLTGGTYLADSYAFELVDAQSGTVLYNWGKGEISRDTPAVGLRMCPSGPEVYDNGWRALPWENPDGGEPGSSQRPGISSPDCAHVAYRDRSEVTIRSLGTEVTRRWTPSKGIIQSLSWSPDSSLIMLVISHGGDYFEKFEYDELVVVPLDAIPAME